MTFSVGNKILFDPEPNSEKKDASEQIIRYSMPWKMSDLIYTNPNGVSFLQYPENVLPTEDEFPRVFKLHPDEVLING